MRLPGSPRNSSEQTSLNSPTAPGCSACGAVNRAGDLTTVLKRAGATLRLQLPPAPPLSNRAVHAEPAFFVEHAQTKNNEVMTPGQMSHQWCDFFVVAVRLEELTHAKQVGAREPPQPRMPSCDGLLPYATGTQPF